MSVANENRVSTSNLGEKEMSHSGRLDSGIFSLQYKVIIIGDANVGKTCLAFKMCDYDFPEKTETTIGFDFHQKTISVNDQSLKLQIWDTAGAERYRGSVMSQYYRNVSAIIIVFDVTRRSTFDNVTFWLSECDKHTQENNLPRVLVGNKCDRESNREVFNQEAQNFADKHHIPFFAVSAKEDHEQGHLEDILSHIGSRILERGSSVGHYSSVTTRQRPLSVMTSAGTYMTRVNEEGYIWDEGQGEYVIRRVIRNRSLTFDGIEGFEEEEEEEEEDSYEANSRSYKTCCTGRLSKLSNCSGNLL